MIKVINIYCDESCHLENDDSRVMVIGACWCEKNLTQSVFKRIRTIKENHGLGRIELKWNKVSPAKVQFYEDIIDYYFANDDLHFRAIVVPDKTKLNHKNFNQTHDEFYYKLYFRLIEGILVPGMTFNVYFDIKDTRSQTKVEFLKKILNTKSYDMPNGIINKVQQVKSHEVSLIQLTDLLTGAVTYANRGFDTSSAKVSLVNRIKIRSGYSLLKTTLIAEHKMNILQWNAKEVDCAK